MREAEPAAKPAGKRPAKQAAKRPAKPSRKQAAKSLSGEVWDNLDELYSQLPPWPPSR